MLQHGMIDHYDSQVCRCRMLGHEVPFSYCRRMQQNLPCSKVADCWYNSIPVEEYLRSHFTDEEIEKIFAPPKQKIATLIDLIEKAKKNCS
jgi:hypothetical protein